MNKFIKCFLLALFLICVLSVSVSADTTGPYVQSDVAYNMPYVSDYYTTLRFSSRTLYTPTLQRPDAWIDCPTVFYCFSVAHLQMSIDLGNTFDPHRLEISIDNDGGSVSFLNHDYSFPSNSNYVPVLLFIVYNGHITCYDRTDSFSSFLFDIKYDSSTVPRIAATGQYSYEIAYLVDSSLHTNLADLGLESYSGAYTAGQIVGSPVTLPVDNLLDGVTQSVITPFTSAIQPLIQSSAFNSLLSIFAFILLFGLLIFIITKIRGG